MILFYSLSLVFCIIPIVFSTNKVFKKINSTELQDYIDKNELLYVFIYVPEEPDAAAILKALRKADELFEEKMSNDLTDKKYLIYKTYEKVIVPVSYFDELISKYEVQEGKLLAAFMENGERNIEYTNSLTDVSILTRFLWQKTQETVIHIDKLNELKPRIEANKCSTLGLFSNFTVNEYNEYLIAADWFYECDHFATTSNEIITYFKSTKLLPTVKYFKECIHEQFDYPLKLQMENIPMLKFFLVSTEPDVGEFGMKWLSRKYFVDPKFTFVLFIHSTDEEKESHLAILNKYARRYRDEISFVYVEVDQDDSAKSMLYTFNLNETDVPSIRAIELSRRYANNTRKYIPRGGAFKMSITNNVVNQFIGDVYYRQLEPYLVSEKLPADWNQNSIIKIVGDNFRNITEKSDKIVALIFHDGEPRYERIFKEYFPRLINQFKSQSRNDIIFAESNHNKNEFYGFHPQKLPGFFLFLQDGNYIKFDMEYNYEDVKKFVESHGKINKIEEEKPNEQSKISTDMGTTELGEDEEGIVEENNVESNTKSEL